MDISTKELIESIASFGLSDSEIAKRVSSTQPTISRLRNGTTRDCLSNLHRSLAGLLSDLSKEQEGA